MFFFYTIPLLVCIITGVAFFTKDYKNIPLGLLFIICGLMPFMNILFACVGMAVLIYKAMVEKAPAA